MKKIFTLLTLLVAMAASAWADDVTIFSTDFTNAKYNVTYPTTQYGNVTVNDNGTTVTIQGYKSTAFSYSSTDGITCTGNNLSANAGVIGNSNPNYFIGIPLTGVNGSITVTTTGDATKWYYAYTTNAGQTEVSAREQASDNGGFTITGLTNTNVTLYICSNAKKIKTITVTTPAPTKTIATQGLKSSDAVKVGKTTLTLDAATSGYSVSGTTITLSDDQKSAAIPNNVKLVNHIVYTDESTEDDDVDVSFDGTVTAGYYIGTATIGENEYTVKVKKDDTPTLTLSGDAGTVTLKSFEPTGSVKVTVSGTNLTGSTFTAPTVDGVTITPASVGITDGAFSQEFTITTTATTAASTVIGFAHTGATTQNYTLTYSKVAQRGLSQTNVSTSTTWDWKNAGSNTIELTETTSPTRSDEFLMANLAELNNDENFNSQALNVVCQFPTRGTSYYFQGNSIKFTTTVPGTVQVYFSNTGSRDDTDANRRYLYINENNTGVYTLNTTMTNATANVAAGEVVINAYTGQATPVATMVRINKIVFTPSVSVGTLADRNYASHVTTEKLDFGSAEGITAYIATGLNSGGTAVEMTPVNVVPAGTPIIVKTDTKGATVNVPITTADADDVSGNKLVAGDGRAYNAGGNSYYYLAGDMFHLANADNLVAGKAYLEVAAPGAPSLTLSFGDNNGTTAIESVEKAVKADGVYYNLSGQRVAQPTKGLYIVNGRKVIIK